MATLGSVAVVVPARDAAATLDACLAGLAGQVPAHDVVVVDNGSRDATAAIAEAHPVVTRVLRRARGEGPGAARDAGAAAAATDVIAFLDADCVPQPGWLAAGLAALADADLVQGRVVPPPGARRGPWDRTLWVTTDTGLYESANLFVRRAWLERAGGFEDFVDPGRERPFGEDTWFAWRARRHGARVAFCPGAEAHHAVFAATARDYLGERRREARFCDLVARVPELRDAFLWRRAYLGPRAGALHLALAATAAAAVRRSPLPLLAAAPYLRLLAAEARARTGVVSGRAAAVVAAGDLVAAAAKARASLRTRTPVL